MNMFQKIDHIRNFQVLKSPYETTIYGKEEFNMLLGFQM
jgi:hypothetical protein